MSPPAPEPLLQLNTVTVSFDGFRALNQLSLIVEEGELRPHLLHALAPDRLAQASGSELGCTLSALSLRNFVFRPAIAPKPTGQRQNESSRRSLRADGVLIRRPSRSHEDAGRWCPGKKLRIRQPVIL